MAQTTKTCPHRDKAPTGSDTYLIASAIGCPKCELTTVYDGRGGVLAVFDGEDRVRQASTFLRQVRDK